MDLTGIVVIAFVIIFIAGGLIASHFATKASQKDTDQMNKIPDKK